MYKVLGSADFLGNPVGLFSNLGNFSWKIQNFFHSKFFFSPGTGVLDFFYEPAQGLISSPEDFGKGLAKVKKKK